MDKRWTANRIGGGLKALLHNLLLLLLLLAAGGPASGAEAPRITLRLEGVSLGEALRRVSNAAGYEFFYNSGQLLDVDKRIDASYDNTPLQEVLDDSSTQRPLRPGFRSARSSSTTVRRRSAPPKPPRSSASPSRESSATRRTDSRWSA